MRRMFDTPAEAEVAAVGDEVSLAGGAERDGFDPRPSTPRLVEAR